MHSIAEQDYLKAIFQLTREKARAGTGDLALRLGVTPASVTGMLRRLRDRQPVPIDYEKHAGVSLTAEGRLHALDTLRKHRLLELFLVRELGFGWDEVHDEAERLEHAVSDLLIERLALKLGDPEVDPHGDPIPRADGTMPERPSLQLLELPTSVPARVTRIRDQQPELLRYLGTLGLVPGARITVLVFDPFEGPVTLQLDHTRVTVGRKAASAVTVEREIP